MTCLHYHCPELRGRRRRRDNQDTQSVLWSPPQPTGCYCVVARHISVAFSKFAKPRGWGGGGGGGAAAPM